MSIRHFTMSMICIEQHKQDILLKNEKWTWKHVLKASHYQKLTKPKHQTQQNIHKPYSTSYSQNSTKTQNPRNRRLEIWNTLGKIENPYLFLKIDEEMMKKMEDFWKNIVSLEEGDNEQSQ